MTKLLTGIPKKGRKAVYSRMTGWSRLLLLPKFRQGVDPRFQMEHMNKNSNGPSYSMGPSALRDRIERLKYRLRMAFMGEDRRRTIERLGKPMLLVLNL